MDKFDLAPESRKKGKYNLLLLNVLTGVILVGVLCLGGYFLTLFINPYSALNLFPPPPLPTLAEFYTPTYTPIPLAATWTATNTIEPSATRTEAPTWTPIPTNTPFYLSGRTPTRGVPTKTPKGTSWPYSVTVSYISSSIYYPDAGCAWMGVAGPAVDKNNAPIMYLTLHLGGFLSGQEINYLSLTGTAPNYGISGFEFHLGSVPIASSGTMWIQVLDQASQPLTDRIFFDTFNDCSKNLVLFRFKKK